jgi:hypothetical protein
LSKQQENIPEEEKRDPKDKTPQQYYHPNAVEDDKVLDQNKR